MKKKIFCLILALALLLGIARAEIGEIASTAWVNAETAAAVLKAAQHAAGEKL